MIQFGSFGYEEEENKEPIYFLDAYNCPFRFGNSLTFTVWDWIDQMYLDKTRIPRKVCIYHTHELMDGFITLDVYGSIMI